MWPFRKKKEDKKEKFDKFLPLGSNEVKPKEVKLREIKEPQRLAFKRKTDDQILQFHEVEEVPDLKFSEKKKKMPSLPEFKPEKILLEKEVKPKLNEVKIKAGKYGSLNLNRVVKSPDEQRLGNFVKLALSQGYTKDDIRLRLLMKGWPDKLIDKILWQK